MTASDPKDSNTEGAPNDEVLTDGNLGTDADFTAESGDEADGDALNKENATNPE
ncbi:MAG TPA: hypothetical protein VGF80_02230 [Galbitalea sp.]